MPCTRAFTLFNQSEGPWRFAPHRLLRNFVEKLINAPLLFRDFPNSGITPPPLSVRHLLSTADLTREDMLAIFRTALAFRDSLLRTQGRSSHLRGRTVINLFMENSTRTRSSFELAERRLGADVLNFQAERSSVSKGETLLDTVRNIEAMHADAIVVRHSAAGAPWFLARRCKSIILNAGDGRHEHPTQALLDALTLYEIWRDPDDPTRTGFEGKRVTIVGDILHGRVALSNIHALKHLGAEVALCAPPTLVPRGIECLGVRVFIHLEDALGWSDALNMLRIQQERQEGGFFPSVAEYSRLYGLNRFRLRSARKHLVIMHPGPINRGVELDSETADGPWSVILKQVENGIAVRMAVLAMVMPPLEHTPDTFSLPAS